MEAWNRYAGVIITTNPTRALEVVKYQTLITMAFQDYPPKACIEYDRRFRQLAAKDKKVSWEKYEEDIFIIWCFSPKPGLGSSYFRNRPAIFICLGPASDAVTFSTTGNEICIRFNTPEAAHGAMYAGSSTPATGEAVEGNTLPQSAPPSSSPLKQISSRPYDTSSSRKS